MGATRHGDHTSEWEAVRATAYEQPDHPRRLIYWNRVVRGADSRGRTERLTVTRARRGQAGPWVWWHYGPDPRGPHDARAKVNAFSSGYGTTQAAKRAADAYFDDLLAEAKARAGRPVRLGAGAGRLSYAGALEHYDDVATLVAQGRCGEDEHGVWFADVAYNAPGPSHRKAPPGTSTVAAARNAYRSGSQRSRVLVAIADAALRGGLTTDEICRATDLKGNSARPRLIELRADGFVEDSGEQRPSDLGDPATVWRATEAGYRIARELRP